MTMFAISAAIPFVSFFTQNSIWMTCARNWISFGNNRLLFLESQSIFLEHTIYGIGRSTWRKMQKKYAVFFREFHASMDPTQLREYKKKIFFLRNLITNIQLFRANYAHNPWSAPLQILAWIHAKSRVFCCQMSQPSAYYRFGVCTIKKMSQSVQIFGVDLLTVIWPILYKVRISKSQFWQHLHRFQGTALVENELYIVKQYFYSIRNFENIFVEALEANNISCLRRAAGLMRRLFDLKPFLF